MNAYKKIKVYWQDNPSTKTACVHVPAQKTLKGFL